MKNPYLAHIIFKIMYKLTTFYVNGIPISVRMLLQPELQ